MRRTREMERLLAPAMIVLLATACGGDGGDAAAGGGETGQQMEHPVDEATAGRINGTVRFTGTAPAPEPIDMSDEPQCADTYDTPPERHRVVVGDDGGLANVFVYVKEGLDESLQFPGGDAEMLDQEGCEYRPHVVALQTGQTLTVRNSDPVLHNVNATPQENRGFNRSQPQAGMEFQTSFPVPEVMIPVRCDVHGWMESYLGVTGHPYHAVTPEDGGFAMDRLPPGDYVLEAWHERYGTATQNVTVPQSGEVEVTFEFNDQMAGRPVPMAPALIVDHESGTLRRAAAQGPQ